MLHQNVSLIPSCMLISLFLRIHECLFPYSFEAVNAYFLVLLGPFSFSFWTHVCMLISLYLWTHVCLFPYSFGSVYAYFLSPWDPCMLISFWTVYVCLFLFELHYQTHFLLYFGIYLLPYSTSISMKTYQRFFYAYQRVFGSLYERVFCSSYLPSRPLSKSSHTLTASILEWKQFPYRNKIPTFLLVVDSITSGMIP
jgi:hypothetical protein